MRTAGWEHVVPSPNAERAWCLCALPDLAEIYGASLDTKDLRRRASLIREAVQRELWDDKAGWFRCRYPDGHSELIYSVQVFDVIHAGCCTSEMVTALVSHIRDGAFLDNYGVSSVSCEDEIHYEVAAPDWSGSGAYEGEATTLALTLWEQRRARWPGMSYEGCSGWVNNCRTSLKSITVTVRTCQSTNAWMSLPG